MMSFVPIASNNHVCYTAISLLSLCIIHTFFPFQSNQFLYCPSMFYPLPHFNVSVCYKTISLLFFRVLPPPPISMTRPTTERFLYCPCVFYPPPPHFNDLVCYKPISEYSLRVLQPPPPPPPEFQ